MQIGQQAAIRLACVPDCSVWSADATESSARSGRTRRMSNSGSSDCSECIPASFQIHMPVVLEHRLCVKGNLMFWHPLSASSSLLLRTATAFSAFTHVNIRRSTLTLHRFSKYSADYSSGIPAGATLPEGTVHGSQYFGLIIGRR